LRDAARFRARSTSHTVAVSRRLHQHPACGGRGSGRREPFSKTALQGHGLLRFVHLDPSGLITSRGLRYWMRGRRAIVRQASSWRLRSRLQRSHISRARPAAFAPAPRSSSCANSCHWRAAYERPRSTLCCPSRLGLRTDGKRKKAVFGRRRRMRQEQSSCWGRVRTRTAAEQLLNAGPMRLVAKEPSDRGRVRDYGRGLLPITG
jgi:hypothetical protein